MSIQQRVMGRILENRKFESSITVEASIVFSITIFVLFLIFGPMFVIKSSVDVVEKLNDMSKKVSFYQMLKYNYENYEKNINTKKLDEEKFKDGKEYSKGEKVEEVLECIENLTNHSLVIYQLLKKEEFEDSVFNNIKYIVPYNLYIYDKKKNIIDYQMAVGFYLPYNIFNINDIHMNYRLARRAFVGSDGDRFKEEDDEEYIYLSNNYKKSHVYHTKTTCNRLEKKVEQDYYKNINNIKNEDNKYYTECEYCFKDIKKSNETIIYITKYGSRFHRYESCPTMTAYVKKMPVSIIEEENLRMCEICRRREDDN